MPKYSLKDGSILEYRNQQWYRNNKPMTRKAVENSTIKDKDGYYKRLMLDGSLAVQDVDDNGNPIKRSYIGGSTKETRDKYWKQAPIIRHAVDSIANIYGINPTILRHRMNEEGFVDKAIEQNNFSYLNSKKELKENPNSYDKDDFDRIIRDASNYAKLNSANYNGGFNDFGLDDIGQMILDNKVKLINEEWYDALNDNENKRKVLSANGHSNADNIGITAATLKYFREQAKKDFPKASRKTLDEAAGIYFNRGIIGGRNYIKNK